MDRKKYLRKLEDEHWAIRKTFDELEDVIGTGKVEDEEKLRKKLARLKEILVGHVHSEDDVFYRDMRKKAAEKGQDALLPALDFFIKEMHRVSEDADLFFKEYSSGKIENTKEIARRLNDLRDEVLKRITSEEGSLFYIYRAYFFD